MKTTCFQKIIAVTLSLLILLTAAPVAAFAHGETPTGDYYQKITNAAQITDGGRYLIVCEAADCAFDGALDGDDLDSPLNNVAVEIDNDCIAATDELDASSFIIDVSEGSVKSASGFYVGCSGSKNSLLASETSDYVNQIGIDEFGDLEVSFQGVNDLYRLQFNRQSGQERFRFFKSGQTPVQLYQRVDAPVSYVDASGEAQTPISEYTALEKDVREWSNGWYVLKNDVDFGGRIAVQGDNVNLLLCDGKTMSVTGGVFVREGYSLTIWAQEAGTGKLTATGSYGNLSAGIGSSTESQFHFVSEYVSTKWHTGNITINGGVIEATGARGCAGIGGGANRNGGNVTINGGTVTATGGEGAPGIGAAENGYGNAIVINGGTVNAYGGDYAAAIGCGSGSSGGTITVNGGTVNAHGGKKALAIGGRNSTVTLNGGKVTANRGEDSLASIGGENAYLYFNYTEPGYDMSVTMRGYEGKAAFRKPFGVLDNPKRTYNGRLSSVNLYGTFYPKTAGVWTVSFDGNGGAGGMDSLTLPGGTYTLPECSFTLPAEGSPFVCWGVTVGSGAVVAKQPGETVLVNADTTVKAIWKSDHTVSFDAGGGSGTMDAVTLTAYDTYTLPENGFTPPTGKHFYGWSVPAGGSEPVTMQPGEALLVTENVTVHALWTVSITSWAALQTAIDNAADGDTVALGQSLTAGSADLRLLVSGKAITLDLNGYTLDRSQSSASPLGGVFTVASDASLTVCDSGAGGTGTVTGGYAEKGGAFYNGGTLVLEGGAIADNHVSHENSENRGGAIYNDGTLIISDCTIDGNDGDDAGAIFNTENGTAELTRVTISNNTSLNHAGGAIVNKGALTLDGCVISGNTSKSNGGALWTNAGDKAVTISDTVFVGNKTTEDSSAGGAIYIVSGSVSIGGGSFAGNASADGGAIYVSEGSSVELEGTALSGNDSSLHGGGAITNHGTADLDCCDLWSNSAHTRGGAVWSGGNANASLTLTECCVTGNTAELSGGGVCLANGVLNASGTTVNDNTSASGGGLYIHENGTAILGGDGNLFYWNEASDNGGGIGNEGDQRISALFLVQENSSSAPGGGIWNANSLSLKDTVIVIDNTSDTLGKDLYLANGSVVTLTGAFFASTVGVDAQDRDAFITDDWYAYEMGAAPESVFKAPEYYAVYMPDGTTELKIKKSDDNPFDGSATVYATDSDGSSYRTGINYTIRNLTTGSSVNTVTSGWTVNQYYSDNGVYRKTYQNDSNGNVTGASVGTLEIDRSRLDNIEQTGVCVEYSPFAFTATGGVRWGVELFGYSESIPTRLCDIANSVGENEYNTVTLTGSDGGSYTYRLRYGSVDGDLRCAQTGGGSFAADTSVAAGQDQSYGPYCWYVTGDAPAAGESVTLRIAAICCSRVGDTNLQMLTEWTDVTITGTCSHGNGHLQEVAAAAPDCTQPGNTAYWKCDVCGKCFSDSGAGNEIAEEDAVIPATGHTYAEPSAEDWTWTRSGDTYTAEVTVVCENGDDAQTLTAEVEKTVAEDGAAVYTATATVGEGDGAQTFTAVKPTVYHTVTGFEDDLGNAVTADKETAAEGQTVTLTAATVSGCGLKALTAASGEDGVTLTAGANGTFTFIMSDGDVTVSAEFDLNYTVASVTDGHGSVTVDKPLAFEGDTVTLTVTPDRYYALDTLTVTDENGEEIEVTDNTFVMPAGDVSVTASFYENYAIWVGGELITEKNKSDVFGNGSVRYEGNLTEGTLYLTNADISGSFLFSSLFADNDKLSLSIALGGENIASGAYYGANLYCKDVTIIGDGSLSATGSGEGLYIKCPVTVDGATLTVRGESSFAMEITKDLLIRNSDVTAIGGRDMAIDSSGILSIEGSTVQATAQKASYALYGAEGITITDSTVTASAKYNYAICPGNHGMTITNSAVTATSENSQAIYATDTVTITDSIVSAASSQASAVCIGSTLKLEGESELTANTDYTGLPAVMASNLEIGEGLAVAVPEDAVVKDHYYLEDAYDAVYKADGETPANAVVVKRVYDVIVTAPEHGTVTANKPTAAAGDTVTLTLTPDAHYVLDTLTVTDENGEEIEVTDNTFVMPAGDVTVTASFYETYEIYVGGVQVTEKNKADVLGDGSVVYEGDQTTGTLYLTDADITGVYYDGSTPNNVYIYNEDLSLTVALSGENRVSGGRYGVNIYGADVTIIGEGSLSVDSPLEAVYVHCPLVIDSTTITAQADQNFAMEITDTLTINDSVVTASSAGNMAIDGKVVEITDSSVTVETSSSAYALYGSAGVTIRNSTVNAAAPRGDGIYSGYYGDVNIIGSTVRTQSTEYCGISGNSGCTITDSVVEASGKYEGITVPGTLTINGDSLVTLTGRMSGHSAVLAGSIQIGEGLAVRTPENAVLSTWPGSWQVYEAFCESDGQTYANTIVIQRIYNVTVNDAEHGSVTTDKASAFKGDTVTLTVTPDEGFAFDSLTVLTAGGEAVEVTGNTFIMPAGDVEITAVFVCPHNAYTLSGWSWADDYSSASATFVCGTCGDRQNVPAAIETFDVSPADCVSDRVVKYVATAEFGGDTYTDTKENVTLPGTATGHTYGEPVWSWSADHRSVTATFTCVCGDRQSVPGIVTEVEVSPATATADRVVKYTASLTFNGNTYTIETENVTLPGTATGEPDTPPTEPTDPDTPTGSNICKWDNVDHGTSFWGRLVKFFHSILYFFAHLFGRR